PSNYVCSTCKTKYHSAWRLVQHVQHAHGVKIYVESLASTGNQDGGAAPTEESDAPESAAASEEANGPVTPLPEPQKLTDITSDEPETVTPRSRSVSRSRNEVSMEREEERHEIRSPALKSVKDAASNGLELVSSATIENGVDAESDEEIEVRTKRPKLTNTSTSSSSSNNSSSNGSHSTVNHTVEVALALTSPQALTTSTALPLRQSTTPQPPASSFIVAAPSPSHPQHSPPSASVVTSTPTPARSESTQSLPPTSLRAHHSLLPPPELHPNPFGLLRMPPHHPHSPLFGRAHHDFRMEHLMSEQFRSHGLNLAAAAVAAANQLKSHSQQFNPATGATASERPPSASGAALTLTPGGG
uniref:C2H2-type domain-containing protein n=1 Tax=Anopheles maculatus TaxID=74869 RepID=A0A182TA53_9DIPT